MAASVSALVGNAQCVLALWWSKYSSHGVDDDPRNLGASRAVEVRHGKPCVTPLERRELRANRLNGRDLKRI